VSSEMGQQMEMSNQVLRHSAPVHTRCLRAAHDGSVCTENANQVEMGDEVFRCSGSAQRGCFRARHDHDTLGQPGVHVFLAGLGGRV
jgi:hypothetical protein